MIEILLLAIVALPIYSLYLDHKARGWYFFNPINSFWVAFIYAGAVQPFLGRDKWIPFYNEATFTSALAMFLVLGIAIHLGYNAKFGPKIAHKVPAFPAPDKNKVFICGLILLGIGLLGYFLVAQGSGGWEHWTVSPRTRTNFKLSGYVYSMPRVAILGIMVLLCHAFSLRGAWLYKGLIVSIALFNLYWQIYSGTREGAIVMLIIVFGSIYGAQNKNPPLPVIGVLIASAFFAFGFIPSYRGHFGKLSLNITETPREVFQNTLNFYTDDEDRSGNVKDNTPDLWSDFGMAISVAYYIPSQLDYDYGQMLLESFTRPIPRSMWPSKSYPEGEAWDRFHQVSGISNIKNAAGLRSGPSPTMVGKYFYIGGWLGLTLGGFFSGTLLRAVAYYLRSNSHLVMGAIFAIASAGLGAMEMIHPLSWSVNQWLPTIAFPFAVMVWAVRDAKSKAAALALAAPDAEANSKDGANIAQAPLTETTVTQTIKPHALVDPRFQRVAPSSRPRPQTPVTLRSPRFTSANRPRESSR